MAASPFCSYLELGGSVPPPVSLKTRAPIVVHGRVPVEQRGGEGVGWTRTRAAAGIIGLQQRSLTRPWTDGQTWSPKASIPRKPRYNSLSSSSSSSSSISLSFSLAKPNVFARGVYGGWNRMEIRGEPGDPFVFPAKCGLPACLSAALYPFFFFFFLSKCDNFSGTGKLVRRFFLFFVYSLQRSFVCARWRLSFIDYFRQNSMVFGFGRFEGEKKIGWIIVAKNNVWKRCCLKWYWNCEKFRSL